MLGGAELQRYFKRTLSCHARRYDDRDQYPRVVLGRQSPQRVNVRSLRGR